MKSGGSMDYSLLKDKNVLITGASRGIGRQIALSLADKGCRLFLHSRNKEHTKELERLLHEKGVSVKTLEADLSDPAEAGIMAQLAEKESGGIDIVFNNAAIMTPWKPDYIASVEDYLISFKVNVISLIKICDVFLPAMKKRGFGRIVNTTSGIQDQPELTPYAISKAAVDKYVKDMAIKLEGSEVLMNLLDPGWIKTDLGGQQAPNDIDSVIPGALVPALLDKKDGSGKLYRAQEYKI
jgi:NAD(P)-dependent dehydrogenase (short-subunit alcohol dehydrogenase family)